MLTDLLKAATNTHRTPKAALVLGLMNVSFLPWFAAAVWFAADTGFWIDLSLKYEALTLGVFGGVRMGFAFAEKQRLPSVHDYGIAIALPLIAWAALIPNPLSGTAIQAAAILASVFLDYMAAQSGTLPWWYGRLRLQFLAPLMAFLALIMLKLMLDQGGVSSL